MKVYYFSFPRVLRGLMAALALAAIAVLFTGVRPAGDSARQSASESAQTQTSAQGSAQDPARDPTQASARDDARQPAQGGSGTKTHAIYKVKTDRKVVALTFDISWGTKVPGPVMDTLKKNNVKSTFFLSGPWVEKYPEFARRLAAEGHEIASHGNRHIDLDRESAGTVKEEISAAHKSLKEVTGASPNLIRTPNGAWNGMVLGVADQLGYRVIQWSVDSLDWKKPGTDAIVKRVLDRVHPGAIILMHASDTCTQTPDALPRVLEGIKSRGYEMVTVSKLLELGPGVVD